MQLLKFLFIISLICINQSTFANETIWESLHGPEGGSVTSLVTISNQNGNYVFAGTNNGIYRSLDHGEHWLVVLPSVDVNKIVCDTKNTLYAATANAGVYVSEDCGKTWIASDAKSPLYLTSVNDLLVADDYLFAATEKGVFISHDKGAHWITPDSQDPTCNTKVRSLAKDSAGAIYALALLPHGKREVYKTTNHGKNWIGLGLQNTEYVPTTKFLADKNNNLYLSGYSGEIYFYNAKQSQNPWARIALPESTINTALTSYNDRLFTGFENGAVYTCKDNCGLSSSWHHLTTLGYQIFDFLLHGQSIYAATLNGVYASFDGGLKWLESQPSTTQQMVSVLANDATTIYAGTDLDGIMLAQHNNTNHWSFPQQNIAAIKTKFKSLARDDRVYLPVDSGLYFFNAKQGWQKNRDFDALIGVAVDSAGTVFVNNDLNLFVSRDYGQNWFVPLKNKIYCLGSNGNQIYVCSERETNGIDLVTTSDQGKSWNSLGTPEHELRINKLAFDTDAAIYVSGFSLSDNASKVYVNNDNVWKPLCQTAPNEIIGQLLVDARFHNIYATAGDAVAEGMSKIYLYNNSSCKVIYAPPSKENIGQVALDSITGYLYRFKMPASANSGLLISIDHGASWAPISQFRGLQVNDLVVNSNDGKVFVATQSQGVFISSDHGITWLTLNSGLDSLAVDYLMLTEQGSLFAATQGGGVEKLVSNNANKD